MSINFRENSDIRDRIDSSKIILSTGYSRKLENSKNRVMDIFVDASGETKEQVEIKTEFNDVMHFATLIPFLLVFDSKEEKARTAYYQSVILMNKFCNKYGV